jgi:hypothetical protein
MFTGPVLCELGHRTGSSEYRKAGGEFSKEKSSPCFYELVVAESGVGGGNFDDN